MVARDEQKRMAGRVAWRDALGVMTWVTATSRRKEGLTGTDRRRKEQAGDHRTANKRDRCESGNRHKRQVPEQAGTGRKERASRQKGTGASRSGAGRTGAGRCKWGEAGRERWRGARSGRTRKEAD